MSLGAAIKNRWTDAGLETFIKPIWPGSSFGPDMILEEGSHNLKGDGGPARETLPRARFNTMPSELMDTTASCKIYSQKFFIFMYDKSMENLNDWSNDVVAAYENSHRLTTNPFSMDEAIVMHLDFLERQDNVRYAEVKFTEIVFECIYAVLRIKPS